MTTPFPFSKSFSTRYEAWGRSENEKLLQQLVSTESLKPVLTSIKVLAFFVSLLVYVPTLIFLVLGVLCLPLIVSSVLFILPVLFLIGLAWTLRPRFNKYPRVQLPRKNAPELFRLIDSVAEALHTRHIGVVVITADFNASYYRADWYQEPVLNLGYPLWAVLNDEERIALIAHELAHAVNGDFSRQMVVSSACNTLLMWHSLLRPTRLVAHYRYSMVNLFDPIARLIMGLVAYLPLMARFSLLHLLWHESRRAEYLADYLAATVAGKDATMTMLGKLNFDRTFALMLHRLVVSGERQNVFARVRENTAHVTLAELEQTSENQRNEQSRLDSTHPPLACRLDLLRARGAVTAQLTLSPEQSGAIQRELAPVAEKMQAEMIEQHEARLYGLY